jgi:hypothetical protein
LQFFRWWRCFAGRTYQSLWLIFFIHCGVPS